MKLLIIDDDDISSYVSTRFAQNSGLFTQIQSLHNGMDAVEYFQRVSAGETAAPDIVIVDLGPTGNLSHALRSQPIGTLVHGE